MTHYVYQGRVGDSTREYRGVKERGLQVVSPHWLHAVRSHCRGGGVAQEGWSVGLTCVLLSQCAEEQKHVAESLYPFTFNPKMSLTLSQVPSSTQRSPPAPRTPLEAVDPDHQVGPLVDSCPTDSSGAQNVSLLHVSPSRRRTLQRRRRVTMRAPVQRRPPNGAVGVSVFFFTSLISVRLTC